MQRAGAAHDLQRDTRLNALTKAKIFSTIGKQTAYVCQLSVVEGEQVGCADASATSAAFALQVL